MKKIGFYTIGKKGLCCAVVGMLVVALGGAFAVPKGITVFRNTIAAAERKLPIYCVQTPEKKVSISFDAAWGAVCLWEQ